MPSLCIALPDNSCFCAHVCARVHSCVLAGWLAGWLAGTLAVAMQVKDNVPESITLRRLRCGGSLAVALVFDGDVMDVVGDITAPPPAQKGFAVAGVAGATHQRTIVRRDFVAVPSSHWNVSAGTNAVNSEWAVFGEPQRPDPSNLGFHELRADVTVVECVGLASCLVGCCLVKRFG